MSRIYGNKCDRCGKRYMGKVDMFPPHWSCLILTTHDSGGKQIRDETETAMLCTDCADFISDVLENIVPFRSNKPAKPDVK